jgi:hypothetical protein
VKVTYLGYERLFAEWAESQGWDVTKRGWPDFICRRNGEIMAVEVKGGNDDISPEQIDTLDNLSAAGVPTFVYHHGLGLKRWRGRKTGDTVEELRHEIGKLHDFIRDIIGIRDAMLPGVQPNYAEWTQQDEFDKISGWCRPAHGDRHRRPNTRMTFCAWVYFMDQRGLTARQMAAMTGEDFGEIRKYTIKARKLVAGAKAQRESLAA